jgi:hypothetical protein
MHLLPGEQSVSNEQLDADIFELHGVGGRADSVLSGESGLYNGSLKFFSLPAE